MLSSRVRYQIVSRPIIARLPIYLSNFYFFFFFLDMVKVNQFLTHFLLVQIRKGTIYIEASVKSDHYI